MPVNFKALARMPGAVCFYSIGLVFLSAETFQQHLNFFLFLEEFYPLILQELQPNWEKMAEREHEEATWRFCWQDNGPSRFSPGTVIITFILCCFKRYFVPLASSIIMKDFP